MGKLHDMKIGKNIVKRTGAAVGKFIGKKSIDLAAICAKEDPAKVRAFLEDVATDESLPLNVRLPCRELLKNYEGGKPLDQAISDLTTTKIQTLETDLSKVLKNPKTLPNITGAQNAKR